MEDGGNRQQGDPRLRYTIVVEGELPPTWSEWFGVDRLHLEGPCSVLEVAVTDQAQLHGILRRVHDLHLDLRSISLVETPGSPHED